METIPTISVSKGLGEIVRPKYFVVARFPYLLCHSDFGHFARRQSSPITLIRPVSHTALLLPEESGVWISANDVRLETGQDYSGSPQHEGIYTDTFWGWMDIPALRLLHLQCMDICGYSTSTSHVQT